MSVAGSHAAQDAHNPFMASLDWMRDGRGGAGIHHDVPRRTDAHEATCADGVPTPGPGHHRLAAVALRRLVPRQPAADAGPLHAPRVRLHPLARTAGAAAVLAPPRLRGGLPVPLVPATSGAAFRLLFH